MKYIFYGFCLIALISCGKDNNQANSVANSNNQKLQASITKSDESNISKILQQYNQLIKNFSKSNQDGVDPTKIRFQLVWLTNSNLPQLAMIVNDDSRSGVRYYTYGESDVVFLGEYGAYGSGSINQDNSLIYDSLMRMDTISNTVYSVKTQQVEEIISFNRIFSSNNENYERQFEIAWQIDGKDVDADTFYKSYEQYFGGDVKKVYLVPEKMADTNYVIMRNGNWVTNEEIDCLDKLEKMYQAGRESL